MKRLVCVNLVSGRYIHFYIMNPETSNIHVHAVTTVCVVGFSVPPDRPSIENGSRVEVVADQPYNLTCTALNGKPGPNITWVSGGIELNNNADIVYTATLQVGALSYRNL